MRPKNDKKNANRASKAAKRPSKGHQEGMSRANRKDGKQQNAAPLLQAPRDSYFLWGYHALAGVLANPKRQIKALYCTTEAKDKLLGLLQMARQTSLPDISIVLRQQLDMIPTDSGKAVHQGMVAAVRPLEAPSLDMFLATLDEHHSQRVMVLDQVSDPRNIGAILRSARAFGIRALILQDRHAPEETGTLARTAVGALEDVHMIRVVNLARALDSLKEYHFHIAGLDMKGHFDISRAAKAERLALVMGSEGKGMRRLTREACDEILSIQMADNSESLNVSVAAAIIMHGTQAAQSDPKLPE